MSKKYFDTKSGSLEEKITKIATEQPSIQKQEPNDELINAFCQIMQDQKIMPAFRAQLLSQPSISEIIAHFFEMRVRERPHFFVYTDSFGRNIGKTLLINI